MLRGTFDRIKLDKASVKFGLKVAVESGRPCSGGMVRGRAAFGPVEGNRPRGRPRAATREADLALLKLVEPVPDHPCVFLSAEDLRLHEEAYVYEYPDNFRGDSVTVEYEGPSETEAGQWLDKSNRVRPVSASAARPFSA